MNKIIITLALFLILFVSGVYISRAYMQKNESDAEQAQPVATETVQPTDIALNPDTVPHDHLIGIDSVQLSTADSTKQTVIMLNN